MAACTTWLVHRTQLHRETMGLFLETQGFGPVRAWDTVEAAVAGISNDIPEEPPPDLLVVDLDSARSKLWMEKLSQASSTKVVIVANDFSLHDLRVGLRFGIAGYLLYTTPPEAFALSLRLVLAGEPVFPPQLANVIASGKITARADDAPETPPPMLGYPDLQPLDIKILSHLVNGSTNKEIAVVLNMSEEMVKLHLMQTMRKLNVRNRTQAALWMVQSGIKPVPDSVDA
ncbi:LuxR C-terminal-related transcriptional regulator [Azospirillum sp. sgz302134]